jgi:hypothetical protein
MLVSRLHTTGSSNLGRRRGSAQGISSQRVGAHAARPSTTSSAQRPSQLVDELVLDAL